MNTLLVCVLWAVLGCRYEFLSYLNAVYFFLLFWCILFYDLWVCDVPFFFVVLCYWSFLLLFSLFL
jgi:hypothetical protein